jgi:uncharacterized oxidoreductase
MKLTGNTIFITGGGSGIGRGLAEALHALGNQIIVAGRRKSSLDSVCAANPGMKAIELDVADPASIAQVSARLIAGFPTLNVLINNAGIQRPDHVEGEVDDETLVSTITTNLMGPIRLTSALIDHLKARERATIVHLSSMLGILPIAPAAIYCATKAALHSYAQSQRYLLRGTSVDVIEILPTYVQTDLGNGKNDPRAMPLDAYIDETMRILATEAREIIVTSARSRIDTLRPNELQAMEQFNDMMLGR